MPPRTEASTVTATAGASGEPASILNRYAPVNGAPEDPTGAPTATATAVSARPAATRPAQISVSTTCRRTSPSGSRNRCGTLPEAVLAVDTEVTVVTGP